MCSLMLQIESVVYEYCGPYILGGVISLSFMLILARFSHFYMKTIIAIFRLLLDLICNKCY